MQRKYILLSLAMTAWIGLAGCGEQRGPAPVLNLGLHADSATGAILVSEGETLWNISQRYRLPIRNIIDLNNLQAPYALSTGQRLKLPPPVDYRVQAGDTLQSIAGTFGVSASNLVRVNALPMPYRVQPGQNLRIPLTYHRQEIAVSEPIAPPPMAPVISAPLPEMKKETPALAPSKIAREEIFSPATTLSSSKRPDFIWPVRGKVISGYGPKEDGLYNEGINIAAPKGTPVRAAADGVVAYVGDDLKSYGNLVLVRHGGGMMTAYAHMAKVNIRKGAPVKKGQPIGTIGSTGGVASSQLHFEVRQWSKTFDPRQYL